MWRLVRDHGGLELNTGYAYVVLAEDHAATSLVATDAADVLRGFVLGYRPPTRPDVLFVWQVGVDPAVRGQGVGRRMLRRLVDDNRDRGVTHLEATVTPTNDASRRLFRSVARELDTACEVRAHLTPDLFPGTGHEAEELFRIGPV
jgi:L-2,4-diaminobutyric acid acetyltransferase